MDRYRGDDRSGMSGITLTWKRDNALTTFAKAQGMQVIDGNLVALTVDGWIQGVIGKDAYRVSDRGVALKARDGSWWRKASDGWEADISLES